MWEGRDAKMGDLSVEFLEADAGGESKLGWTCDEGASVFPRSLTLMFLL